MTVPVGAEAVPTNSRTRRPGRIGLTAARVLTAVAVLMACVISGAAPAQAVLSVVFADPQSDCTIPGFTVDVTNSTGTTPVPSASIAQWPTSTASRLPRRG